MKIDTVNRRAFLQGAGGSLLAIPMLASLLPSNAQAQTTSNLRFVFMGGIYGRDIDHWYPKQDAMTPTPDGSAFYSKLTDISGPISYILGSAFDPVRRKMSVLRGLDSMQLGDGHGTCVPLTASGALSGGPGFGYSFDAVLEESKKFYPVLPMAPAIRTHPNQNFQFVSHSFTSLRGLTQNYTPEFDVKAIYDRYFNPTNLQKKYATSAYQKSVVDMALADYRQVIASRRLAADDKLRLDHYLSILNDAEKRLGVVPAACGRAKAPGDLGSVDAMQSAAIDLEVAALACGVTKIVTHGNTHFSPLLGASGEPFHNEAHGHGPAASDPSVSQHAVHNKYMMSKAAEFMVKLDAVQESNGTLLDNTIFVYGNGDSTGYHTQYDMPVIVAGGGGRLRTGNYVDYRPRPLKLFHAGLKIIPGRPYNHFLIALFNAYGLGPADYQKFGLQGFGIYDGFAPELQSHYAPFLRTPNAPLPFLLA